MIILYIARAENVLNPEFCVFRFSNPSVRKVKHELKIILNNYYNFREFLLSCRDFKQ